MVRKRSIVVLLCGMLLETMGHAQLSHEDSLTTVRAEFTTPPDSLFVVGDVLVVGNEKTKAFVVLREMSLGKNDVITARALEYDKKRIYNLGLFTRVEIGYVLTEPPKAMLVVVVSERWYVYPFPLVGIKDRDWKKLYFGGGITHQNFRGRNEKLYGALTLGYDPTVILFYRNPLIDVEHNYFLNTSLEWQVIRNRSVLAISQGNNFDERHLSLSLDFGKRIGLPHTTWLSAGYNVVRVTEYQSGRTISDGGSDAFPVFTAGYVYDTRDLEEYAMDGSYGRATLTKNGFPRGTVDFIRYAFDYRRFIPLTPRVSLAGRLFADVSAGGQIPTYNRRYLGYRERVRGHYSRIVEGEQQIGTQWELRVMLLEPRYITVDLVPVPEFAIWKFGIAAAFFGDAGTVWFRNEPLALDQFIKGYGVGIHFLLPYGFVLRTEYALNESRRGEFILDFSAAF